jgi:hypothetical protein
MRFETEDQAPDFRGSTFFFWFVFSVQNPYLMTCSVVAMHNEYVIAESLIAVQRKLRYLLVCLPSPSFSTFDG